MAFLEWYFHNSGARSYPFARKKYVLCCFALQNRSFTQPHYLQFVRRVRERKLRLHSRILLGFPRQTPGRGTIAVQNSLSLQILFGKDIQLVSVSNSRDIVLVPGVPRMWASTVRSRLCPMLGLPEYLHLFRFARMETIQRTRSHLRFMRSSYSAWGRVGDMCRAQRSCRKTLGCCIVVEAVVSTNPEGVRRQTKGSRKENPASVGASLRLTSTTKASGTFMEVSVGRLRKAFARMGPDAS